MHAPCSAGDRSNRSAALTDRSPAAAMNQSAAHHQATDRCLTCRGLGARAIVHGVRCMHACMHRHSKHAHATSIHRSIYAVHECNAMIFTGRRQRFDRRRGRSFNAQLDRRCCACMAGDSWTDGRTDRQRFIQQCTSLFERRGYSTETRSH